MPPKSQQLPPSAFSEPSEPSQLKPGDKPKEQLRGSQEENPQIVVTRPERADVKKKHDGPSFGKAQEKDLPPSAFAELSEPGDLAPKDKSRKQVSQTQEENPQVVVTASKKAEQRKKGTKGAKL